MQKIKSIIYSERIYIGLVIVILLFNIAISSQHKKSLPELKKSTVEAMHNVSSQDLANKLISQPWLGFILLSSTAVVLIAFFLGIFLLAKFIAFKFIRKEEIFKPLNKLLVCPWGVVDVVHIAIITLLLTYAAIFLVAAAAFMLKKDLLILQIGVLDVVAFGVIFYFTRYIFHTNLRIIGLNKDRAGKSFYWAIICYMAFLPIFAAAIMLNSYLMDIFRYEPKISPLFSFVLEEKSNLKVILFILQAGLIAPFAEELFFRGFLYNAIKKRSGVLIAAIFVTTFFALVHQDIFNLIPISCIGFLLVYVYEKTGSLFTSMFIHTIHNLATTLLLLLLKTVVLKG